MSEKDLLDSGQEQAGPVRRSGGRFLRILGTAGLAASVGAAVGFYLADRGVRWFSRFGKHDGKEGSVLSRHLAWRGGGFQPPRRGGGL